MPSLVVLLVPGLAVAAVPLALQPARLSTPPTVQAPAPPLELVLAAPLVPSPPALERLGSTWTAAASDVVGGPRASTVFRGPAAELGVRWALQTQNIPTLLPDPKEERRYLGVAASAAAQGWEKTLFEATRRNPTVHQAHVVLKVLTGGGVDVREKRGDTRARLDPRRRRPDQAEASIEAPPPALLKRRRRRKAPTVFRAGGGLRVRWLDPKERTRTLGKPGLTAYVQAKQLLVDEVQLSVWQLSGDTIFSRMPAEWSLSGRERLGTVDSIVFQASGVEGRGVPDQLRVGWERRLPGPGRWRVGPYVQREWINGNTVVVDSSAGVELKQDASWRVPQRPGQWPLGQR